MKQSKRITIVLFAVLSLFTSFIYAQSKLVVEGASRDITLNVRGPEKEINFINPQSPANLDNCIILLSSQYAPSINIEKNNKVVVVVNDKMTVEKVINMAGPNNRMPSFSEPANTKIPQGGFVLIASDNSYKTGGYKKFLAENFREGDIVKLRINDETKSLTEVVSSIGKETFLNVTVNGDKLFTTLKKEETITGTLSNQKKGSSYKIVLEKDGKTLKTISSKQSGDFSIKASLTEGVNYFDVVVYENSKVVSKTPLTIYQKKANTQKPDVVMWVEQFPNAKTLTSDTAIEDMMLKSKAAGVTAFGIDVKGPEGYVSYKRNDLSHTPYYTATINPNKKVEPNDMDLLEAFVRLAHKHDMKVYASFNCFTEGNVTTSDYAILKDHPEWEEIVQRPEDKGALKKISESTAGEEARAGKRIILGFVNPASKAVQDFQLLRMEEVMKNYDVDGIVLDRCRYDNLYADFSDLTKQLFDEYLKKEGKKLDVFPADAFLINENGKMIEGKYYTEWINFRSGIIKQFTDRVRLLVDKYKTEKKSDIKLAAYVGSWFESYWQNGVNWSSKNFKYNESLNFPESHLYTPKYAQTSYTGNIDFLMIGTYYKTAKEVNKYITLGNILTNGELPLYGSMSLPDLKNEEQAEVFKASMQNSSGLMLFDLCYIKWDNFTENMKKAKE